MENSIFKRRLVNRASRAFAALMLLGGTMSLSSCKDDLLTGMPEWLGSSIYEELEERGQFTQTLALINDPDLAEAHYPELLRLTGSMTMFVADDAAWQRYLSKRGLTSVSQLSRAEKRRLLKSSMINSAYLIELLDNESNSTTEPFDGRTMRRESRMELEDSIPLLSSADIPVVNPHRVDQSGEKIDYWKDLRNKDNVKIFYDASVEPMVHFLPGFMAQNGITNEDLAVISNGASHSVNRSYINGQAISLNKNVWSKDAGKTYLQDITCQNGYIHILDEVPEPLPNMAEIIRQKPQFSIFSELLERFSYPEEYSSITKEDGTLEKFYTKRYFSPNSTRGNHNKYVKTTEGYVYRYDDGSYTVVNNRLKNYDPGWNQYTSSAVDSKMSRDAAAMFVPTNEWMESYLRNEGSAIGAKYNYNWSEVPDNLVIPFLDNCMQTSFSNTVPSKFDEVKDNASDNMGLKVEDVDSCFLACNGAVYELVKSFATPEHQSVTFPALLFANETSEEKKLSIANRIQTYDPTDLPESDATRLAWTLNEFQAYLNSMSSTYSFFLPIDNAYGFYIDPYSLCDDDKSTATAYRFYIDPESANPMSAEAFQVDKEGVPTGDPGQVPGLKVIADRLYDLMDNSIIVHGQRPATPIHPGQEIYLTKAGGAIKVQFSGSTVTGIAGSYQAEKGEFITVTPELTFDMTDKGNGMSYVLGGLPQSTLTSPYQLLTDLEAHSEYTAFANLLMESSFVGDDGMFDGHKTIGKPITVLGNYNYTVYVPQNSEIETLVAAGKFPTEEQRNEWKTFNEALGEYQMPDDLSEEEEDARKAEITALLKLANERLQMMQDVIDNFLLFHIQDGSLFIGGADTTGVFETSCIDPEVTRFRCLDVTVNHNSGTYSVQRYDPEKKSGNSNIVAHVIDDGMNSNQMSRQYSFQSDQTIYSSSYVVTHLIDKALIYDEENQFMPADFPSPEYPEWLPVPDEPDSEQEGGPSPIRKKHPSKMIPLKYYNK